MKLAAQLYTVRDFTGSAEEILHTLNRIKSIGYDAVQISGLKHYDPKSLKEALWIAGLKAPVTHTPLDRILKETESVIKEHKLFSAEYVGIGFFRGSCLDDYKKLLDSLIPVTEELKKNGLKLLYHNHAHELIKFDGVRPLDYMRDNTAPSLFGFLPDFYWVQAAGYSPTAFIRDYSGRLPVVHFKDMRVEPAAGMTKMAEIFEGNMDYESIYKACKDSGAEWVCIEQDECDGSPFDSLEKSLKNLKSRKLF